MHPALLRFSRLLLAIAFFCAVGGHWLVLQTVAWGRMLVEYSQAAPLSEAVAMTFDGKHPCKMCTSIDKERKSEKKQESVLAVKKIEMVAENSLVYLPPVRVVGEMLLVSISSAGELGYAPPSPPPRRA